MSSSDPADDHRARVKRGAYPTPKDEIERAEPFVPESAGTDEPDEADRTAEVDDTTTPETDHGAATS